MTCVKWTSRLCRQRQGRQGQGRQGQYVCFSSKVWSWGWGNHGALGHGNYSDVSMPRVIEGLCDLDIIDISAGWAHCLALTSHGQVYRWGWADDIKTIYSCANLKVNAPGLLNSMQQVGHKMRLGWLMFDNATLYPRCVNELNDVFIKKIVCGAGTSFALGNDGRVYSWGTGRWGQLGHQIYNHYSEEFIRPTVIERLLGQNIIDIDSGYVHSMFLDDSNCLWVCGPGLNGRLGLGMGSRLGEFPIPRPLTPLWKQHFRQQWHKREKEKSMKSIAKMNEMKLLGLKEYNNENSDNNNMYQLIEYNNGYSYNDDSFDDSNDNSNNNNNNNTNNTGFNINSKNSLMHEFDYDYYFNKFSICKPYDPKIVKMRAGHKHSAILTEDGKVWTFGGGNTGALGHRQDFTDKHWPTVVNDLLNEFVIDIDCGQNHSVALTQSGNIYTWGMARQGQCGRPRKEAFMLEDVRERGSDLSTLPHRSPFPLTDEISNSSINSNINSNSNESDVYESNMYKDSDDGLLLRGDPLAMPVGKIANIPKKYKVDKIVAGFYETSIITKCGKVITYGANAERLENEPKPKIIQLPGKIVKIAHGWRHTLALTVDQCDQEIENLN